MEDHYEGYEEVEDTLIDCDVDDAQEPVAVAPGEYKIRITGFVKDGQGRIKRKSDSGNEYFIVSFDIPDEEFSKSFTHIFSIPTKQLEQEDPKKVNSMKWQLKVLKDAFNLVEIKFNDMVGREGYALLTLVESDEYGKQNKIKKFIVGA